MENHNSWHKCVLTVLDNLNGKDLPHRDPSCLYKQSVLGTGAGIHPAAVQILMSKSFSSVNHIKKPGIIETIAEKNIETVVMAEQCDTDGV